MSTIRDLSLRVLMMIQTIHRPRLVLDQKGQSTAEYGMVVLVAIALAGAVLMLFTGGKMDDLLQGLLSKVLQTATGMIKAG